MNQTELFPWPGYGLIFVTTRTGTRKLFALVYHTWDPWFALPRWNPGLKREVIGDLNRISAFGQMVEALTERVEE